LSKRILKYHFGNYLKMKFQKNNFAKIYSLLIDNIL